MKSFISKKDILIIVASLGIGCILLITFLLLPTKDNASVIVTLDGQVIKTMSLYSNTTYTCQNNENYNIIVVNNGIVNVKEASCKNQICVHHFPISKNGETIVCLPNKLVVSIKNENGKQPDIVI